MAFHSQQGVDKNILFLTVILFPLYLCIQKATDFKSDSSYAVQQKIGGNSCLFPEFFMAWWWKQ